MKKKHFEELKRSVKQMKDIEKGVATPSRVYKYPDVRKIRKELHVSQKEFSKQLGISNRTLENWEQTRRAPTGPARVLLNLLELEPARVWKLCYIVSANATSHKLTSKKAGHVRKIKVRKRIKSKKSKV